jgi:hypothetical protein
MSDSILDTKNDASGSDGKRKRKDYQRELAHRHAEFVKLKPGSRSRQIAEECMQYRFRMGSKPDRDGSLFCVC